MSMPSFDAIREQQLITAINAVRVASVACQAVQKSFVGPETLEKKDKSPVTVADFASQAIICAMLTAADPDAKIVGEEDATELRQNDQAALLTAVTENVSVAMEKNITPEDALGWIDLGNVDPKQDTTVTKYWTLDPIDGTKGFIRGEQYAVALALIENGEVTLGVLGCPNLPDASGNPGTIFYATRGGGAFLTAISQTDAAPTQLTMTDTPTDAPPRFCESVESGHSDQDQSVMIARHLGITADPVRMDSQCKYATVARGDASIYLRLPTRPGYEEKIWDHAAGLIVVQEAGGTVTDITGKPLDFTHGRTLANNKGVVATHGYDHAKVIGAIEETS